MEYLIAVLTAVIVVALLFVIKLLLRLDCKLDYAINTVVNAQAEILSHAMPKLDLHGLTEPSLVGSITTTPDRIALVHLAIESMMMQSVRPRCINLYVSDALSETPLPYSLTRLRALGLDIHFVEDVGPHTKLIYALRQFPDDMIVTFDDDMIYPSNTVDCLLKTHRVYPHAIAANWARAIPLNGRGQPKCIKKGKLLTPASLTRSANQKAHCATPGHHVFAYGTGGVLYPPGALDPRVQDVETFRALCPTEDDIWFKAMAMLAGTPVVPANLGIKPRHHNVRGSQLTALRHHNYKQERNRTQMRAVFEAFDLLPALGGASRIGKRNFDAPGHSGDI